ncbi:MAG: MotA/TolQ/ExbB proton channel family protein [Erythrobacter sp.]|nr:MotA/TolQ/ExbB proton channel family protein [Erythrobacter sp.]
MPTSVMALLDLHAFTVVTLGTVLATLAHCGWRDTKSGLKAAGQLGAAGFDEHANRAALARFSRDLRANGRLRVDPPNLPDRAMTTLIRSYLLDGSLDRLRAKAKVQCAARIAHCARGARIFETAGELAPVFGLVGTLFAITQLAPNTGESATQTTMAAVAVAVLSSLYGVLSAHLVYLPLGRAIERRGELAEAQRSGLIDWFEAELSGLHEVSGDPPKRAEPVARAVPLKGAA